MNATLGHIGALVGFLGAVAGAGLLGFALLTKRPALTKHSGTYVFLVLFGALLAVFAMERALITNDFTIEYIATNHSRSTPLLFTIATMWAALEGSILLWCAVLAIYLAALSWRFRARRDDPVIGWATFAGLIVATFFFGLLVGPADPFAAVQGAIPSDGPGPNPLLQNHPLMAFHPPMLYAGYVGFTVPFAFGIAALITGRLGEGWLAETRRWTLLAWLFLTTGIVLGAWWSYEVLGWGGYWAWDPVENASLLPWLTATAYLHSVMVQERRAMLRVWNLSLIAATFSLTILGTFFTRSGVLDSVHAFSESPLGPALLTAFAVVVAVTCGLVFWRANLLGSPGSIHASLSREAAFLANNIAFAAFAFVVLLGTVFPLLAEVVNGQRLTIGRPFFDGMTEPIGLVLLFLMAVAPALPWRGGSAQLLAKRLQFPALFAAVVLVASVVFGLRGLAPLLGMALGAFVAAASARQIFLAVRSLGWHGFTGRASGGMIAHIGIAVIAVAIVISGTQATRAEVQLVEGQSARVAGHTIAFEGLAAESRSNSVATVANLRIDGGPVYQPSLSLFSNSSDAVGQPSVKTSLKEDIYLTLVRTPARAGEPVVIGVIVNPMVVWLWIGGAIVAIGTALALVRRAKTPSSLVKEDLGDAGSSDLDNADVGPRD